MRKLLPYIFILMILVGLFSPILNIHASTQNPSETCQYDDWPDNHNHGVPVNAPCNPDTNHGGKAVPVAPGTPATPEKCYDSGFTNDPAQHLEIPCPTSTVKTDFEKAATDQACPNLAISFGCVANFFYWVIYTPAAFILVLAARFFNAFISLGLDSTSFSHSTFIPDAWAVVRDISNIFFILILLYIAIQIILDMHSHEAKQMIVKVVIVALLINFSMFFTQIIIDTSNVLALIFYNKINVTTMIAVGNGQPAKPRDYDPARKGEKDISGGMYTTFDPTTKLNSSDFFKKAKTTSVNGQPATLSEVPPGIIIGVILLASAIMLFAAYCFFVSGISFLSRLIELWVLIIFSPFAFMSSTFPLLGGVEYVGWKEWSHRLLTVAFMAPIFMFFIYLIFMLINANLFGNLVTSQGLIQTILAIIIPTMIILILLLKATKFAKKGSGAIGEMVMKGAKIAGGLALGAATGGTSLALQATVGRAGNAAANSGLMKRYEASGWGGEYVRRALGGVGTASFDARAVKIGGKTLGSATGMNVGAPLKGGFAQRRKEQVAKRQARAASLEVGEDEPLKQHLNRAEEDLQGLLRANSHELEEVDKEIKSAREKVSDKDADVRATQDVSDPAKVAAQKAAMAKAVAMDDKDPAKANALTSAKEMDVSNPAKVAARQAALAAQKEATDEVKKWQNKKKEIKEREMTTNSGRSMSIKELEEEKGHAHDALEQENSRRQWEHAATTEGIPGQIKDFILSGGVHSIGGAREAAHKIRIKAKIEHADKSHGEDDHGGGGGHAPAAAHPAATPAPAAAHPVSGGDGVHHP